MRKHKLLTTSLWPIQSKVINFDFGVAGLLSGHPSFTLGVTMKVDEQHVGHFLGKLATAVGAVTSLLPMHKQHSHKLQEAVSVLGILASAFSAGTNERHETTDNGVKVPASDYAMYKEWLASRLAKAKSDG